MSARNFPADVFISLCFPILIAIFAGIALFLMSLQGTSWIIAYASTLTLSLIGAFLIFRAKWPLYRQGRFFTFGVAHVPEQFRQSYRWGWRLCIVSFAVALTLLAPIFIDYFYKSL